MFSNRKVDYFPPQRALHTVFYVPLTLGNPFRLQHTVQVVLANTHSSTELSHRLPREGSLSTKKALATFHTT